MKRKHHGIFSVIIMVLVLVPAGIYAVGVVRSPGRADRSGLLQPLSAMTAPSVAVLKDISRLEKKMSDLVNPPEFKPTSIANILGGRYPETEVEMPADAFQDETAPLKAPTAPSLTFTFVSDRQKFCIIDGSFYGEGSELPDGGKVLKIEPQRVWVEKEGVTISVSPAESTRWEKVQ